MALLPAPAAAAEFVCSCYRVTEGELVSLIGRVKARAVEEVTSHCDAGGACRACHFRIRRILAGGSVACPADCALARRSS